jgi:SAM-dependent methyltransferase
MSSNPSVLERYQFKPFVGSSHAWALSQLLSLPPTTSILDIGSGSGWVGRTLHEAHFENVSAVEMDPEARQKTAALYRRQEPSLGEYRGSTFDCLVLLDVLEHLATPELFLREAINLLCKDGILLLSVPNIAHWSVRLPLLFGSFRYYQRGILDKTHLRFFTRKTFHQFIHDEGVTLESTDVSIPPAEFVLPETITKSQLFQAASRAHLALARAFPGLFGYQILVVGRKSL